ncbi:MAG: hypothetical protein KGL31_04920, partial [candidate division NC10 bacterium]|nr:hypothetical protein [candidate division NC10 bacterium]
MMKRITGLLAAGGLFLLMGVLPSPAAAATSVTGCGGFGDGANLRLDADLNATASCLTVGNASVIDLNGHSITGPGNESGPTTGIAGGGNVTIKGPGIVRYFGTCIRVGNFSLIQDVLADDCHDAGIVLG